MSRITVLAPDYEAARPDVAELATRVTLDEPVTITLIENGKPNARQLLSYVAKGLGERFPVADVEVHSKPSAGKPIDADEAEMMAARSHLVLTGIGD